LEKRRGDGLSQVLIRNRGESLWVSHGQPKVVVRKKRNPPNSAKGFPGGRREGQFKMNLGGEGSGHERNDGSLLWRTKALP